MAHKTLINGTRHSIDIGGKCKVNGTSYKIAKGKALVNGTVYSIPFYDYRDIDNVVGLELEITYAWLDKAKSDGGSESTISEGAQAMSDWTTLNNNVVFGSNYIRINVASNTTNLIRLTLDGALKFVYSNGTRLIISDPRVVGGFTGTINYSLKVGYNAPAYFYYHNSFISGVYNKEDYTGTASHPDNYFDVHLSLVRTQYTGSVYNMIKINSAVFNGKTLPISVVNGMG